MLLINFVKLKLKMESGIFFSVMCTYQIEMSIDSFMAQFKKKEKKSYEKKNNNKNENFKLKDQKFATLVHIEPI